MANLTLLVFGILKERAGATAITVEVALPCRVADLREAIASQHPEIAQGLSVCRIAADGRYTGAGDEITEGMEVAIIPPVSGGHDGILVRVQTAPIDVEEVHAWIADPACGGNTVFCGNVRNHHHGKQVAYLTYEAYESMAETQLGEIAREMAAKHDLRRVAVIHRIGRIEIGDTAICVGVASAHRAETFAAVAAIMNRIKADVPVFKHEVYTDGSAAWVRCEHGTIYAEEDIAQ